MTDEACVCSARRRFAKRLNRLQARNLSYTCLGWNSCPLSCMQLFKIDFPPKTPPKTPETLTDPNEILQAYVDRTRTQRVKILAPWAKGAQNGGGGEKVHVFVTDTMNFYFFVMGQIGIKFGQNVNLCPLLNFNARIRKIFS